MIATIWPHDDAAIADFWVTAWQGLYPDIDFEARRPWVLNHLTDMRAGQCIGRAYFDGVQPIGFYTLYPASGLIEQICVSPRATGQGIGAALMRDARGQTSQALNLVVNEDNLVARQFYAKLGFVEVGRGASLTSFRPVITLEMAASTD